MLAASAFCGENQEETRLLLEQELQTERADSARQKIETLLSESNRDRSTPLSDKRHKNRTLGISPDGDTLFWREEARLFFYVVGSQDNFRLDLPGIPTKIKLSYGGRYGLAVFEETTAAGKTPVCRLLPLSLYPNPRALEESLVVTACESEPAITDRGVVYYVRKGALMHQQSVLEKTGAQILNTAGPDMVPAKSFPAKYAKIKSTFVIHDIPGGDLLIFHGSAGFYRLYHYPGKGPAVKRIAEGIARSALYPVSHSLALRPPPPPAPGEKPPEAKPPEAGFRLKEPGTPAFYVYGGAAGRYVFRRIDLGTRIKIDKGFKLKPLTDPVYLQREKAFLIRRGNQICLWAQGKKLEYLPLESGNIQAFNGGLAYEDAEGRLLLRRVAFTHHEQELLGLKFQAEKK